MFKFFWVSWEDDFKELDDDKLSDSKNEESDEWQIALDIIETPYDIVIVAPIAWIDLDDIDISLDKSVLTISWTRKRPDIYEYKDNILRNSECYFWSFVRNIILPDNLDFDTVKASMENNLLVINISKLKFSSQNIKIDRIEW